MYNPFSFYKCLLLGLSLLLAQCANPIPLTGGEKDETPPGIDSTRTTPNMQTNFEKQTIELTFDEWVKLNDVFKQVVISPPIDPNPEIKLKGKTVQVEFDETAKLRENATYTINFGTAVQDLTEGNSPKDLRFVFSTGDFIDSLEVEGILKDVEKGEPQEGILVMLYDNLADSVVRTERPFYFAKTDKEGHFHIQNVRADTFKIVALDDQIPNYTYDATERIGFLEEPIIVPDTTRKELSLQLFKAEDPLSILAIDTVHYGRADVLFNKEVRLQDLDLDYAPLDILYLEAHKDTLHVWYELGEQLDWTLFIAQDSLRKDTLEVNKRGQSSFLKKEKLRPYKKLLPRQEINPTKPLILQWNHPLVRFDTASIRLYEDSLLVTKPFAITFEKPFAITFDSLLSNRQMEIDYAWKEEKSYRIELLPNALTDIYGLSLQDTVRQMIRIQPRKSLGNLNLTINKLDSTQHYLIQIISSNEAILETFQIQNVRSFKTELKSIKATTYTIKIVTDRNRNGFWDTGNYDLKRQAEPIFTKKLEALRANWDLEAEVELNKN